MKDSINIDGKIYISSRRGAEISKYSNDYIGQLCRGGKVSARMMGRTWFVDQESLLDHKKNSEEAFQTRCRNASIEQKNRLMTQVSGNSLPTANFGANTAAGVVAYPELKWTLTYGSDTRALLPQLNKKIADVRQDSDSVPVESSSTSQRMLAVVLVAVIMVTGGFLAQTSGTVDVAKIGSSSQVAHVYESVERIAKVFENGFNSIVALFRGSKNSDSQYAVNTVAPRSGGAPQLNGMAVVPSGSDSDPLETEQRIRDSFSDVVEIKADESGTTGVITPVFKKTNGDDFMYVLVPVKEEKK